jgi:hypothetical protein
MLDEPIATPEAGQSAAIDLPRVDSVALQRLIAEVRQSDGEAPFDTTLYNRSYHRHNR